MEYFNCLAKALGLTKFFFRENVSNYVAVSTPEIATQNIGDEIIADAVMKQLATIFENHFFVKFPTQTQFSAKCLNFYNLANLRFVGGSNLMTGHIRPCYNQWDVSLFSFWKYREAVLMGVGWQTYQRRPSHFAKIFYSPLLSRTYMHSVRDAYTEKQMRLLGYDNVINTACPTTWDLTPEHCAAIPKAKRPASVITITDYAKDPVLVRKMIEIVRKNYSEIYFFQQGTKDLEYLKEVTDPGDMRIIPPTLKEYDRLLEDIHPDFIGTRLHGGIRALQHSCRSLIIGIDNRALELSRDIHLPVVTMDDTDALEHALTDGWDISVRIPSDNIRKWKEQFEEQQ